LRIVTFQPQWLPQAQFAGFYVAHKKGFYTDYGLDVRIENGGQEMPSPQMLATGRVNIATMFLTSALREYDHGTELVNLAQLSQKSAQLLVAKKSHGINKVSDINGKRVGIWFSDFMEPPKIFLKIHKLNVTDVPIGWTVNLFMRDGIDMMNMMLYNEYDVIINSGVNPEELTVFPLADYGVNIPEDGIYCTKEYYEQNKDIAEDFAAASLDGWLYALHHEDETLAIVLEYQKRAHLPANIPHQRWMLAKMKELILAKPNQYGILTEQDFNFSTQVMYNNNFITHIPKYAEFALNVHATKN